MRICSRPRQQAARREHHDMKCKTRRIPRIETRFAISRLYVPADSIVITVTKSSPGDMSCQIFSLRKHQQSRFRLKRVHPERPSQSQPHHDASMTRLRTASWTQYSAITSVLVSIPEVPSHPLEDSPEKLLEKRCQDFIKMSLTDFCRSKRLLA